ncbi:MAG: alpha/beta hydrolase [Acidobacteria bacterium]|nr:MAG: alpha/beta hydrolase [Acidobacteriota bacterium]REK08758.1 MAG: alpha/beta hydrolase [Acidobacteriota bacterium]
MISTTHPRYLLLLLLVATTFFARAVAAESSEATSHSFDSDGVGIHYRLSGPTGAEPVLLIHGYRAAGSLNWSATERLLAERYRVITIDNRGHGKSDKPEDPAAYGRAMVRDQVRLLDHLGVDSAHVAGYSMGGMIALRMLVDHPERVRSAAICGMGWTRDDEATRRRYAESEDAPEDPVHRAVYRAFGDLGISREQLEAIEVPMVAIVGDQDGLYEGSVVPLREVRPDVPLVLVEGASHMTAPMKPAFREALAEWLDLQATNGAATVPSAQQR